jgi:hypothetical protein
MWGRHGWPRKDERLRIYRERDGGYFLLEPESCELGRGYDAIANVYWGDRPSLCSCTISPAYLLSGGIKRVQWCEVPEEWQAAFRRWLPEGVGPEAIRGYWLVGQQPQPR